ncbi:MAG: FitA-like ribbon-helix-helix domain-containing protein [Thermoleophilaceae bacterium]
MGVLVQIRDVPVTVHRTLKARAALAGTSLSEYLRQELDEIARRPSREELLARVLEREPGAEGGESAAETVRALRESR